jgi:hypothetical protein
MVRIGHSTGDVREHEPIEHTLRFAAGGRILKVIDVEANHVIDIEQLPMKISVSRSVSRGLLEILALMYGNRSDRYIPLGRRHVRKTSRPRYSSAGSKVIGSVLNAGHRLLQFGAQAGHSPRGTGRRSRGDGLPASLENGLRHWRGRGDHSRYEIDASVGFAFRLVLGTREDRFKCAIADRKNLNALQASRGQSGSFFSNQLTQQIQCVFRSFSTDLQLKIAAKCVKVGVAMDGHVDILASYQSADNCPRELSDTILLRLTECRSVPGII